MSGNPSLNVRIAAFLIIGIACPAPAICASTPEPSVQAGEYIIDPAASSIRVLVYRGGLLGRLGHNHVVSGSGLSGTVVLAETLADSHLEMAVPVSGLQVDDPDERRAAGEQFAGDVPDADKEGTRRNMLGPRLLNAASDDVVYLQSTSIGGTLLKMSVSLQMNIRGQLQHVVFPATVDVNGATLRASGERTVSHKELGLKPFSAAVGALRVKDKLVFRYSITAVRHDGTARDSSRRESALPAVDDDGIAILDETAE
jgi:hypothetical protein